MRLLGAAQAGGSTIAECRITANRIDPSDDHSWCREWTSVADTNSKRGNAALREGYVLTAKSNWLRAINYYQSAAFPLDRDDSHYRVAIDRMRQCARVYLGHCSPQGEVLSIPWPGGYSLEAYFLPAAEAAHPKPHPPRSLAEARGGIQPGRQTRSCPAGCDLGIACARDRP
jgi:hypothetical protein